MELSVNRIDHIYVTVRDLQISERFYDPVMQALGFRKGTRPIAGEPHAHYFNRAMQYTLRPARSGERADPYRVGALHHLCFQVDDVAAVDEAQRRLIGLGVDASQPALYTDYRPDYYASFFEDPDGIRLEVVCDTAGRKLVRERWHELSEFVDPVQRLLERDALAAGAAPGSVSPPRASVPTWNLFSGTPPVRGEVFERLVELGGTRIERISSSDTPGSELYVQAEDEWVALLRGHAQLEIAGQLIELGPGDAVLLPARTPHRVRSTASGSLWLAVHVRERADERGPSRP